MATYNVQMQRIWKNYEKEVTPMPTSPRVVAAWAIKKGLWQPHPSSIVAQCADDLTKALREEYRIDGKGRRFRVKHAVRTTKNGEQLTLWADIDFASRGHMERSFSQRRKQIVGDCYHLKTDMDCYNSLNSTEVPMQMIFDFTKDIQEMQILEGVA